MGYPTEQDFRESRERRAPPAVAGPMLPGIDDLRFSDLDEAAEEHKKLLRSVLYVRREIKAVADTLAEGHSIDKCIKRLRELVG